MSSKGIRVLHCPTDVGGNAWPLSRAERELGMQSDVMVMEASKYSFRADVILSKAGEKPRLVRELRRWAFLVRNLHRYDIFHFNGGQSFFTYPKLGIFYIDLPFIRHFGKKIVMTFSGCDARFPSDCGACAHEATPCRFERTERLRHRRCELAESYTDYIFVTTPDLKLSLPTAEWRPQTRFIPDDVISLAPDGVNRVSGPFQVVHAPTRRVKKGTGIIEKTVLQLMNNGIDIKLILIEGMTHDRALETMRSADVVIDQLYIGWYGGVSVEGMALSKPVICYINPKFLDLVPDEVRSQLPLISATTIELGGKLQELIGKPAVRTSLGRKGQSYVMEWHNPRTIAKRTVEVYSSLVR